MAGDQYRITDQQGIYFLTFTIVNWVDLFTRKEYKTIIVDSLNYCIEHKGLECFAWVLMSNHMHLIVRAKEGSNLSDIIRDFKKFTSKKLVDEIQNIPESRKDWLLDIFGFMAKRERASLEYKVWKSDNHAIYLEGNLLWFKQRLDYIHQNPVKQMIVANPSDYLFSSAYDYAGMKGLVNITIAE